MAVPSFADEPEQPITGKCGENLTYTYYQSTKILTIDGTGDMFDYDESPVNGGWVAPWKKLSKLEKAVISDGVTSIGTYAFYECYNLTSIEIADSVTSIGDYAFLWCNSLPEITIPNSVTHIGERAFSNCTALTGITIPGSVTDIGDYAFYDCGDITAITLSEGVKNIGDSAFNGCKGVTSIEIPKSVTRIGDLAFKDCDALTSISLPDDVTSIGYQAFYNTGYYNADGKDSNWENHVLYIGNHLIEADAWELNDGISNGKIPGEYTVKSGTKTIADRAFENCKGYTDDTAFEDYTGLTRITLPDGVINIGNYAFNGCTKLTSMEIPDSVTSIGKSAFLDCTGLTGIDVDIGNTAYCSENGVLYNKEKTEIMRFPCKKADTSFTIPNGVTSIAGGAFNNCGGLTSITIPNGVKSIGEEAFSVCYGLTSVTIPDGVTSIGKSAFYHCYYAETAEIDGKTQIVSEIGLEKVTIPNSVTSIGDNAFLECYKLTEINYIGGRKSDWDAIEKGSSYLTDDSIVKCRAGIKATTSDNKITVEPIEIENGKAVILTLYNGDKFIGMQSDTYNGTEMSFTISKTYTKAKVMIWESLGSMSPVCGVKTAER